MMTVGSWNHLPISATALAKERLAGCAALVPGDGAASGALRDTLTTAADRLDEPMRLAVVGQVKRGKSTLVNALLGMNVVATARRELTFNVNELHYAESARAVLHFRDGREPQHVPPGELDQWNVHDADRLTELSAIRKIEYGLDNPLLRSFRLVDTPGLGSVHGLDSSATLEQLGITDPADGRLLELISRDAATVHGESRAELDQADAVLYLFSRGLHTEDHKVIAAFSGAGEYAGTLTPLKAFGVLSKCDDTWPPDPDGLGETDPMAFHPIRDAQERVRRDLDDPGVRRIFYHLVPVAARVAAGAQLLAAEHFQWLSDLSRLDPRRLAEDLADEGEFATAKGGPVPAEGRRLLVEHLGPWGIHLACTALRDGYGEPEVRAHLVEESGVSRLRDLVQGHFGNRSMLIKLNQAVRSVRGELARYREDAQVRGDPALRSVAEEVGRRIEQLEESEHRFAELKALAFYYQGQLDDLSEREVEELLQVTGERGTHCAVRLGLPLNASLEQMEATVQDRIRRWAARANDPMLERHSKQTARIVQRSFDVIAERVRLAARFLEMSD
jgi:hypothetical protein